MAAAARRHDLISDVLADAERELHALPVGARVDDGFLAIHRTADGFVVCDREAEHPVERPAWPEEALEFLVAIRGARPRLMLVRD